MAIVSILACLVKAGVAEAETDSPVLGLRHRDYLFGGLGGLRDYLADRGAEIEFVHTAEYFGNLRGGLRTGGKFRGDLSLTLSLDTERAGWWENGEFFAHFQAQYGDGISGKFAGDFQVLSNIDADDYAQISEIWYRHEFRGGRFALKFGKQDANANFAFTEYGGEFINSSPGFSPTIPLVTYPDQDWGVVLEYQQAPWFSIAAGVFQGRPDGGRSLGDTLENLYGPMVLIEPALHYTIGGKAGHLRIGYWWNGDRFEKLAPEEPDPLPETQRWRDRVRRVRESGLLAAYLEEAAAFIGGQLTERIASKLLGSGGFESQADGFYATWDQALFEEDAFDEENPQGLGVFAQFGYSDGGVIEAERYFGFGFQWTGAIPGRDDDVLGIGIFHAELSDAAGFDADHETVIEGYYKAQITPWCSVKPDIQYIRHPGGTNARAALAAGVRVELSF